MYIHERKVLKRIIRNLKKRLPESISSVYVFGSKVRGDYDEESDFDILIIIKNKSPEIEKKIIGIIVDEEQKSGLSFAPVIKDIRAFDSEKRFNTPFYRNIITEGVQL